MRRGLRWWRIGAGLTLAVAAPAGAFDGVAIMSGKGLDDAELLRLSVRASQWDPPPSSGALRLGIYWELGLGIWQAARGTRDLLEVGLSPMLRLQPAGRGRLIPYIEAGVGAHVVSEDRIGIRTLSSRYLFGPQAGFGLVVDGRLELGMRFLHFSNADIVPPNMGMDFTTVRAAVRF